MGEVTAGGVTAVCPERQWGEGGGVGTEVRDRFQGHPMNRPTETI